MNGGYLTPALSAILQAEAAARGLHFDVSDDGRVVRLLRPDGTVAVQVRRRRGFCARQTGRQGGTPHGDLPMIERTPAEDVARFKADMERIERKRAADLRRATIESIARLRRHRDGLRTRAGAGLYERGMATGYHLAAHIVWRDYAAAQRA